MTAFTSRTLARHASLLDLAAIWVTLTATFAYLEVPLVNAPLFATALVLQAALGTVVITRLLKDTQPSLLMLLGPGLILGGALSFAIFQVVGRGIVGVVASTLAGLASAGLLVRSLAPETDAEPRWWMLGQLVGVGVLAITREFSELLPIAAALFTLGFTTSPRAQRSGWLVFWTSVTGVVGAVTSLLLRDDYWWLVTDDYLMLEVIARHLTIEGPFSPWGVNDFANYHWLSYGWSGLVDLLGGSPEPLLTLTRVMPIIYSLSMAASLTLLAKRLGSGHVTMMSIAGVWAVVAVGRFEWTGTSTGGVHAVLAAAIALSLNIRLGKSSISGAFRWLIIWFFIVVFTKMPSVFALVLSILTRFLEEVQTRKGGSIRSRVAHKIGLSLICFFVLLSVWAFGNFLDGRIRLTTMNPGLGQLSTFSQSFVAPTLILNQLWLWIFVGVALWQSTGVGGRANWKTRWLTITSATSLLCALILEMSLSGATNTYTYFSGPLYFFASLSILAVGSTADSHLISDRKTLVLTSSLIVAGLLWGLHDFASSFWDVISQIVEIDDTTKIELLKFFTVDRRVGTSIFAVAALLVASFSRRRFASVMKSMSLALTVTALFGLAFQLHEEHPRSLSKDQVVSGLGSDQQRTIGEWLRRNTGSDDIVGTNYLFDETGGSVSDFAFAVWSQREFLVLGPQLGYGTTLARSEAFALSRSFAEKPTERNCAQLKSRGVTWFVVDERLTINRNWSQCTDVSYLVEDFVVLKFREEN